MLETVIQLVFSSWLCLPPRILQSLAAQRFVNAGLLIAAALLQSCQMITLLYNGRK